jgi:hypothetical protein
VLIGSDASYCRPTVRLRSSRNRNRRCWRSLWAHQLSRRPHTLSELNLRAPFLGLAPIFFVMLLTLAVSVERHPAGWLPLFISRLPFLWAMCSKPLCKAAKACKSAYSSNSDASRVSTGLGFTSRYPPRMCSRGLLFDVPQIPSLRTVMRLTFNLHHTTPPCVEICLEAWRQDVHGGAPIISPRLMTTDEIKQSYRNFRAQIEQDRARSYCALAAKKN